MNPTEAVRTCFSKYATFNGRARRSEYWWWVAFYVLAIVVITAIAAAIDVDPDSAIGLGILLILLPSLTVSVRRLHDTNRSGWYILIGFIPLVGGLILLFFTMQDSTPGPNNSYGSNPKAP